MVITCLDKMVRNAKDQMRFLLYKKEIRMVLEAALKLKDDELKEKAVEIVHRMGSMGLIEFRELIQ
mgnify:CR=1 FL=1